MNISFCIISNHKDHEKITDWHKIFLSITFQLIKITKIGQKRKQEKFIKDLDIDLMILARYMQILSDKMCKDFFWKNN